MTLRLLNTIVGLLLLAMGIWTLIDPTIFTKLYAIILPEQQSRVALRAIIGGGEIGLGLFLCFGGWLGASQVILTRFAALLFGSVVLARSVAFLLEENIAPWMWRELLIETLIAVVLIFYLLRRKRTDKDQ